MNMQLSAWITIVLLNSIRADSIGQNRLLNSLYQAKLAIHRRTEYGQQIAQWLMEMATDETGHDLAGAFVSSLRKLRAVSNRADQTIRRKNRRLDLFLKFNMRKG